MKTLRRLICGLLVGLLWGGVSLAMQPTTKELPAAEPAETETTPEVNPIWHTVKTWTVSGVKTTESFTISRAPWRVKLECEEGGKAAVFVNSGEKTIEVISGTIKVSYIHERDGEFYLRIISPVEGTVHVEVQQPGAKAAPPMRQLIASYLDKMGYVYTTDETEERSEISLTMRGENNQYDLRIFIDDDRKIAYMCVNRFLICPTSHPRLPQILQRLMELNWKLLVGKYEWDKNDGEVRLSYTFSTENSVGYEAFVACFQVLVMTADSDYPELMSLMWGGLEKESEALKPKPKPEPIPPPETKTEPKDKEELPPPPAPEVAPEPQPSPAPQLEPADIETEQQTQTEE